MLVGCQDNPVFVEAPLPPTELRIDNASHHSLQLNWKDNSVGESGFIILRNSGGNWKNVGLAYKNRTRWIDKDLEEFTKYHYQIFSVKGNISSSEYSADSAFTLLKHPENFTTSLFTNPLQVRLSWKGNSVWNSGFVIERNSSIENDFIQIAVISADIFEYLDTVRVLPELLYRYRIAATNDSAVSAYVHSTVITPRGPPLPPTKLSLRPVDEQSAALNWKDESHNEDGFDVESRKDGGEEWSLIGRPNQNITEFIDRTVKPLEQLEYRVRSYNRSGFSDFSEILTTKLAYFQINNGDEFSQNRHVSLSSESPFSQFMALSNDSLSLVNDPAWISYTQNQRWSLSSGYGVKAVFVRFLGFNSVVSPTYVDHITPSIAELFSFVLAENADTIQSSIIDIVLSAANADSMQIGQSKDLSDATWVPYLHEFQFNLNDSTVIPNGVSELSSHQISNHRSPMRDAEGYKLYARVRNSFGIPTEILSGALTVNIIGSLEIDNGAQFANSRIVELKFDAPAADFYAVSNDSSVLINDLNWLPIRPNVAWLLETGHLKKTVFVRYKNRSEVQSSIYSASIIPAEIEPTVVLDGGSEHTADREIIVSASAVGKIDSIQISSSLDFSQAVWQAYQTDVPYILPTGSGEKTVYCRILNDFEMVSSIVNAKIHTMTMNPSIILDQGAEFSPDRTVRVDINATGKIDMMLISNFADFQETNWIDFQAGFSFELLMGPGEKFVYVKLQNVFEAVSETVNSSISPLAINPSIIMNDGVYQSPFRDVDLLLGAEGAIDSMQLSFSGNFDNEVWEQYSRRKKLRVPKGIGVKMVYCRFINNFQIISTTVVDSIEPLPLIPNIQINSGDDFTRSNHLSLAMLCNNAMEMNWSLSDVFDENNWIPYRRLIGIEIDDRDGNYEVFVKFRHEFITSDPISDQIMYDTHSEIDRFSWESEREEIIFQGDELRFELIMHQDSVGFESDGNAEVSIGAEILGIQLEESELGIYTGTYEVPEGIFIQDEIVSVNFTDRAGNIANAVAEDCITIHAENHDWQFERTDNNHNILILNASISGNVLENADDIGVFTEDGNCAGILNVADGGFPDGLTAWGDDPSTDEIDGFVAGEKLSYRFWDASRNFEHQTGIVRLLRGSLTYQVDGITVLSLHGTNDDNTPALDWLFQRTADNHNVLIREALIDDEEIGANDIIGLFTPAGLCVGTVELGDNNFPVGLTAWADDPATEATDGFRNGEEMMFRIWGDENNIGMATEAFDIEEGDVEFNIDGISVLSLRTIE